MCPPRKGRKIVEKKEKEVKVKLTKPKDDQLEPPKVVLTPGVGWTPDNFSYLKTVPGENQISQLYVMFGIPDKFIRDRTKAAIHVFIEFNLAAFRFAQQFQTVMKSMSIIAILTDYITSVPAFTNPKECFSAWIEKATNQVKSLDFTPNEIQVILTYLNKNVRENAHIHSFVLTKNAVEELEKDGINIFRTNLNDSRDRDADAAADAQRQSEFEAQQRLLEQAMKEKKEAEEKQRQEELAATIQNIVAENFAKISSTLESRNETLIQQIISLEEKIDGPVKGRRN